MTPQDLLALVGRLESLADRVCLRVCELPDRTSPDDWPEACLVTSEELHAIITDELAALKAAQADTVEG